MLLLDAGNSRCKWAFHADGAWQQQGVLENADTASWQLLQARFAGMRAPQKIVVSNVAGETIARRIIEACSVWGMMPEFVTAPGFQCGVHNAYEQAGQLGSDRWCALIAAWKREQGACLVVNCGTATTIDALTANGEFTGGLILPGMTMMQRCLTENTAQLNVAGGARQHFPRNTADAIYSGAVRATAGAILQQRSLLQEITGLTCPVLLSGGAACLLVDELHGTAALVDDLVLQGLYIIGSGSSCNI